jgi:2-amino-4-hydroxy-6-hydroxymethyldihydropteridine diphosphokinase
MTIAYVGLGSNLAEPRQQVEAALNMLSSLPRTTLLARSRLYATEPWGQRDQPGFVNAVAALDTQLSARELLDSLLAIERRAGRERNGERWGPRILDLDILLFGDARIDEPALHVPHPRLHERAFVLVPLAELAPLLYVPGAARVLDLLSRIDASTCTALESAPLATK